MNNTCHLRVSRGANQALVWQITSQVFNISAETKPKFADLKFMKAEQRSLSVLL
jgi:hypothetical protein